jgi:hypothetical protein
MATIHDLPNPSILTLPNDGALALMKQLRASRRTSKANSLNRQKSAKTVGPAKARAAAKSPRQLAAQLSAAQLLQVIQEMEGRLA